MISQISTSNTFGQLVTSVSALIAVSNNMVGDGQSQTNSSWTFTNPGVGINVGNTARISTGNISILNSSTANITGLTVSTSNISTANITIANVVGATVTNLNSTRIVTTNANVTLLQVTTANVFSLNAQSANIGSLSLTTLSVTGLTVSSINTSFANITDALITGTFQASAILATLTTTSNANVGILNLSTGNITGETVKTSNISFANITSLNVSSMNLSTANITTLTGMSTLTTAFAGITLANIGTLNASTANISNLTVVQLNASIANLTTGTMSANPTTNLSIATKNYVDTGAGQNLVNKISYTAKGDLIPGTGANSFGTLSSGANGQTLIVDTNQTTGLRWANTPTGIFRNLMIASSPSGNVTNNKQAFVYKLDEVIMNDGEVVTNWTLPALLDISVSGVNGLDGGTANANTVYEVYAIRQRSTGTKNFIIHRALDRKPDQNTFNNSFWPMTSGTTTLNTLGANNTANLYVRLAQSFTPNISGPLTSIDIRVMKTNAPTGNMWLSIEANTSGSPDGTTLTTSRKMDVSRCPTTGANARFVFDNTANLVAGTSYFWIFNTDYTSSATAFMNLAYSSANTNITANGVNRGIPMGNTGASWVNIQGTTQPGQTIGLGTFFYRTQMEANNVTVTMPTGYDQMCLLGYLFTDNVARLKDTTQIGRTIYTSVSQQWGAMHSIYAGAPGWADLIELNSFVPPVPCSVTGMSGGPGSPLQIAVGRFHALDLTTTFTEGFGGYIQAQGSGGTTTAPIGPIFVEHQAILVRVTTQNSKFYPIVITF